MMTADACNLTQVVGLLDYAYLATNVYHDPSEDKLLGSRPKEVRGLPLLLNLIAKNQRGWFCLKFKDIWLPDHNGIYAEFYVKIYKQKIQHLMVAFLGTVSTQDWIQDITTWHASVLHGNDSPLPGLEYWHQAIFYLSRVRKLIVQLDKADLLSDRCDYYFTGHSLGGALANLSIASAFIHFPAAMEMKTKCCLVPKAISFNPPGIGAMSDVCEAPFLQGQVISMRAEGDIVSAIGKPFGFVINNEIPEGHKRADISLASFRETERLSRKDSTAVDMSCDAIPLCSQLKHGAEGVAATLQTPGVAQGYLNQHIMKNFLKVINEHPDALTLTFGQLAHWAVNHGDLNHDETAAPLYKAAA